MQEKQLCIKNSFNTTYLTSVLEMLEAVVLSRKNTLLDIYYVKKQYSSGRFYGDFVLPNSEAYFVFLTMHL